MSDKLVDPDKTTPETPQENAADVLQKFLNERGITIRLSPPNIRMVDDGSIIIDKAQVIADFKTVNSITQN